MVRSDSRLELGNLLALHIEVPLKVAAHFPLHLVDLLEREHLLRHYAPRLVGVSVVTNDL